VGFFGLGMGVFSVSQISEVSGSPIRINFAPRNNTDGKFNAGAWITDFTDFTDYALRARSSAATSRFSGGSSFLA
jgi:hypothetical protein